MSLRAIAMDKMRERLLGLVFVPAAPSRSGQRPTLPEILAGRVKGKLYDAYRQSWVASPEPSTSRPATGRCRPKLERSADARRRAARRAWT